MLTGARRGELSSLQTGDKMPGTSSLIQKFAAFRMLLQFVSCVAAFVRRTLSLEKMLKTAAVLSTEAEAKF
jgi:hypothetical protein